MRLKLLFAALAACSIHSLAQQQPDASAAVDAARAAARADRNKDAADQFRAAIAQAPQRRRELLLEYADQLLYSQRGAQAVPLYEEVLQAPRDVEERRKATKGLGLAYL